MKLSEYEQETISNFNQGEETAYINTCSKAWACHMEKILGFKPTKIHCFHAREANQGLYAAG